MRVFFKVQIVQLGAVSWFAIAVVLDWCYNYAFEFEENVSLSALPVPDLSVFSWPALKVFVRGIAF